MKLGKLAPIGKKSVSFGQFVTSLPPYPIVDAAPNFKYPMDGNDQYGDCVVAGYDHSEETYSGLLDGKPVNYTIDQIYQFYKTQNPGFPQEDNGMDIQLFLEYLVKNKYITAFGHISWQDEAEMKAAIYLGLSIMTGVQLQQAQMGQQFADGVWDYVEGSPIEGGHCINLIGYDGTYYEAVTWGKVVKLTKQFVSKTMDEAWFVLTPRHIAHHGFRNSFDLAGFSQAISEITEGKVIVPVPPAPTASYTFTKQLTIGSQNQDVLELQKYLNTHGFDLAASGAGSPGNETNYYGSLTRAAVERFQLAKGIVANSSDPGYGQVGPKTRAVLNGSTGGKTLVDAMIQVESGGNDYAEGDKTLANHAYGCLQIRQGVVDAINKYLGTSHRAQECLGNRDLSLLIFNTYWKVYPQFVSNEDKAKCWNGGPGWKSLYGKPGYETYTHNLDIYWAKVEAALT